MKMDENRDYPPEDSPADAVDYTASPLIEALVVAQAEFKPIKKTAKATIPTKSGGKYTYTYATLDAVRNACDPALNKNGLVVIHTTEQQGDGLLLTTRLEHVSGETRESVWPLAIDDDPRKVAASMTYAMRYTYCAMVGVVAEEPDGAEGNTDGLPMPGSKPKRKPAEKPKGKEPPPKQTPAEKDAILKKRAKARAHVMCEERGIDEAAMKKTCGDHFFQIVDKETLLDKDGNKVPVTSRNQMTTRQWNDYIDYLETIPVLGSEQSKAKEFSLNALCDKVSEASGIATDDIKAWSASFSKIDDYEEAVQRLVDTLTDEEKLGVVIADIGRWKDSQNKEPVI